VLHRVKNSTSKAIVMHLAIIRAQHLGELVLRISWLQQQTTRIDTTYLPLVCWCIPLQWQSSSTADQRPPQELETRTIAPTLVWPFSPNICQRALNRWPQCFGEESNSVLD